MLHADIVVVLIAKVYIFVSGVVLDVILVVEEFYGIDFSIIKVFRFTNRFYIRGNIETVIDDIHEIPGDGCDFAIKLSVAT